ncbi:M1 family aminopeptidase [Altererythrobacter sp.]|uniref:ABC transporter permease/M1 family aminopeptidase n=1 Tax=Altererythrobacter sp. TaxID=1872480 RepID=UPI001B254858|nr:M1 family aminopeptidase [Altererythrobacter sp.]MBO6697080.1 aminopeptidase [Henriciella sp.]MBO6608510.1 aminopeptidase [Altererythrobacter sp.]MBO6641975.1 aminopeptidase [Altererythrobacter sp.]MBO6709517.1 aminopeptidase [Altererythrobacter sp.]MBO6944376.1 aminopeptidase [Altererythrobacter sp.]
MFGKIALFELRYQIRNPVFWVAVVIFFLLTFGATTSENIQIGGGGNVNVNSPFAILQTQLVLTLFYMFVTTAFVANVVVRDDESGFGPMVRSTQVSKFAYLIGRFSGAALAALLAFVVVPLAIFFGSLMPWIDPETVGPNRFSDYAISYAFFAAPTVLLLSALFFAVATMTRSMIYSYVAVVGFLVLYVSFNVIVGGEPDHRDTAALIDPLGFGAVANETRYWTAAESNSQLPDFSGAILLNRLMAISLAVLALALAYWRFSFSEKGVSARQAKKLEKKAAKLAKTRPQTVARLPDTDPENAALARLFKTTRFEVSQVFRSPAFLVLLIMGLFNSVNALAFGIEVYGTPPVPATFSLIPLLAGTFTLIPIIIAIYYGGELVWRDRDRKFHEVIDSTSLPGWAYMVPKTIAVTLVLLSTLLVSVVAAMAVQAIRGYFNFEFEKYLMWYILPFTINMLLIAVLSVFVQALSPNKFVGWGIMVLYVVASITLDNLGYDHPLFLYGTTGFNPVSDMNADAVAGSLGWWLRLYWGGVALLLAVLAHLLWRRGTETRLLPRIRQLPRRLASGAGALGAAGVLVAASTGAYLYNQMNVQNTYRNQDTNEQLLADYEKEYYQFASLKQPSLTDITLDVEIYPDERRMEASGTYRMVNDTGAPVEVLHVRLTDPDTQLLEVDVTGAKLEKNDETYQHRVYRFDTPLQPDATASLTFRSQRWHRALTTTGYGTRLVENGTFLNNSEFAPQIGMDRSGLLTDRSTRRRYDLEPELRPAKLEDESARERNYVGNVDWVNSDITITTAADQVPIAPGSKVLDEIEGDRRTARFQSTAPILGFFSIQSARYEIATRMADGVELQVYYDAQHPYNVERMLDAMERSLAYYRAHFGPYQFDHARIIEFPGYASFAQAFAGTMPYSESIGFLANLADPGEIDYVTYITAHEVAHQYWAHQLISADMQGGTMLVETLAQHSALMVMKEIYGEDQMRRFLKFELDIYLSSRGSEAIEELPLERVENQGYIHYRKGSVVMYLLQERLGEDRVNAMLAGLLDQYRFKSQPYASSKDLVEGYFSLARNEEERALVEDLLQRITVYDLKADEAVVRELDDGRFETTITLAASKFYADGEGRETEAELADQIEIGLFTDRPGSEAFAAENVILMERRAVRSGEQEMVIITDRRPVWVGIDPYNKYVDRNSDDNLVSVS